MESVDIIFMANYYSTQIEHLLIILNKYPLSVYLYYCLYFVEIMLV